MAARALAAGLAAAVLAAAGCGGGGGGQLSKADYQKAMSEKAAELTTALRRANLSSARSLSEFADRIGTVKPDIQKAADGVDGLKPPSNAVADTQKIADALHQYVDIVGQIQKAAEKGNVAEVSQAVAKLRTASAAVQPAVRDLKRKGYDIGSFAG